MSKEKEQRRYEMSRDILTVIQSRMGTFSKGQKRIGRFILDFYD